MAVQFKIPRREEWDRRIRAGFIIAYMKTPDKK
jgi:hypothetical protein